MSNLMSVEEFQIVEEYKDKGINIPKRATQWSAGYDIEAAEDIIVPSIFKQLKIDINLNYIYLKIFLKTTLQ